MSSINPVSRSMNGIKTIETSEVIFTDDNSSLNTSVGIAIAQQNSTTAINGKINSVAFNTDNGVLTLTKEDGTTLTKDLDGRYFEGETLDADDIPDLPASKITSGTFDDARIPNLNASKITAGTLGTARIPDLPASQITTGTLGTARIPDLPASQITTGTLGTSRIPDLPASQITTGTLATARIPDLNASKITSGTIATARIPDAVLKTGDQDITGTKTFNNKRPTSTLGTPVSPPNPTPPADIDFITKEDGDGIYIPQINSGVAFLTGANTFFNGSNSFNPRPTTTLTNTPSVGDFITKRDGDALYQSAGGGGSFVGTRAYLSSTSGATASPWIFSVSNYCSPSTLYNNTTGKFLIPSDGKYYFSLMANVITSSSNDFMNIGLTSPAGTSPFISYVRGLQSFFSYISAPNRNYHTINVSGVFDLTAGTQLQWGNDRAVSYILSGSFETSICCFKVG